MLRPTVQVTIGIHTDADASLLRPLIYTRNTILTVRATR